MSDFFHQHLKVEDWNFMPREAILCSLALGKKVLHIGCVDAPIFDAKTSLHLTLEKHAAELHGFDTAYYGPLQEHTQSTLLGDWPRGDKYDLVLVPEVLEHVGNVESFIKELDSIDFERIVITVPDAYSCSKRGHWEINGHSTLEIVHPDHVAWYSPYTLRNVITRFAPHWKIEKLFYLNNISVGISCTK